MATELYERLRCLGYWGVGTGFALAAELHNRAAEHCASSCPVRERCARLEHKRVHASAADLASAFCAVAKMALALNEGPDAIERNAETIRDGMAAATWLAERGKNASHDPFLASIRANVADGQSLALTGSPVARGADTRPLSLPQLGPGSH